MVNHTGQQKMKFQKTSTEMIPHNPIFSPYALSCWKKKKKQRVCSFTNAQRVTNSKVTIQMLLKIDLVI